MNPTKHIFYLEGNNTTKIGISSFVHLTEISEALRGINNFIAYI